MRARPCVSLVKLRWNRERAQGPFAVLPFDRSMRLIFKVLPSPTLATATKATEQPVAWGDTP